MFLTPLQVGQQVGSMSLALLVEQQVGNMSLAILVEQHAFNVFLTLQQVEQHVSNATTS